MMTISEYFIAEVQGDDGEVYLRTDNNDIVTAGQAVELEPKKNRWWKFW